MEAGERRNGDSMSHNHRAPKKPRLAGLLTESDIDSEFAHHQTGVARINNGSFGCCPGSVLEAQREWQLRYLRQPDEFYFNGLRRGLLASRTVISDLINADDVDEVSLVDNATTAAAIVLQKVGRCFSEGKYKKEDTVVMFHCAFQSVKKSIQAYVSRVGGSTVEVRLPFPVNSNEEIISKFREGLEKGRANGRTVRLAIIDHITSMPCVLMPVRELVKICREEGVEQVFVDAAHAIGSVKVDVKEIGADYYVSNLHKWFFCPPSIAFFYCKKRGSESDVHHPVVSHEFGNGLPIESAWIGTRDYSSQLVVPSVMEFVNRFEGGMEGIMMKNHDEAVRMGLMLADAWGTNLGSPPEMCVGMVMIGLPSKLCVGSDEDAIKLRSYLRVHYSVEVPVFYLGLRDGEEGVKDKDSGLITAYVRISHQVYNKTEDYERLRDAITELVKDQMTCQNLPAL
ncbi:L-cysteine desulfhydrase [Arabidopsis thaliana]|jgi:selenocysteine lyase/cysteine desulfurase|uniref:L-cysteine desulfhydrase n=4 Tax=Arabidopsis TaxID=3701 RepID=LCYD1_ARATH|nr:Pyridoxal phosphate (PLP)-dependent transferases superfamily protein [Arabidopsis thaliana]NP_191772.1 Pyridoxal phosphate (PLP)-dependent transferases superfamily protein [Arabidopsis thaliana]Q9M1R1.1 RecName: Full=L-cysteine desulfhydrase; AltName: Full=AtL-CDes1; Short=L-CDes1; AltName: Full=AtLCD [Arabidopsis thaliana]KAG7629398.1 Pyridoxal phosphate-dependent transferase [Arabidopsis thaliana x Arabidopsis arenosa]KAG7635322.1 Pyridoxal phosphate-dependent transferase [Arabidopsis suec|eukprot:NP_001327694.1 Pyridoxal phosphate (PLP)-dependent transferases superfamily protein [Arabidopsis thaliana]